MCVSSVTVRDSRVTVQTRPCPLPCLYVILRVNSEYTYSLSLSGLARRPTPPCTIIYKLIERLLFVCCLVEVTESVHPTRSGPACGLWQSPSAACDAHGELILRIRYHFCDGSFGFREIGRSETSLRPCHVDFVYSCINCEATTLSQDQESLSVAWVGSCCRLAGSSGDSRGFSA